MKEEDLAKFILDDAVKRRQLIKELAIHRYKDAKSIYDDVVAAPQGVKHGYIAIDGVVKCDTLQCSHCGGHFPIRKDSGTVRGICKVCMKWICGRECCRPDGPNGCMPWEMKMEIIEAKEKERLNKLGVIYGV